MPKHHKGDYTRNGDSVIVSLVVGYIYSIGESMTGCAFMQVLLAQKRKANEKNNTQGKDRIGKEGMGEKRRGKEWRGYHNR
jgi:hypothetical protein